jgi:hypothetical protein
MKDFSARSALRLMSHVLLFVLSAFVLNCLIFPAKTYAAATTKTLYPTADALVYSGEPNTNYGYMNVLEVGYTSSTGVTRYSFVKFDVSSIPSNATITDAHFRNNVKLCESTMTPNLLYTGQVKSSWTESTITWKTMPSFTVGNSRGGTCDNVTWWGFDVKTIVQNWVSGQQNYGLVLMSNSTTSFLRRFYSREASSTVRPQLSVTYTVPIPSVTLPGHTTTDTTTPSGSNPTGSNPTGTNPTGSNPTGTNPTDPGTTIDTPLGPVDTETFPFYTPFVGTVLTTYFPCLAAICCCLPLLLLLLIIILLARRGSNKQQTQQQAPVVVVVQPQANGTLEQSEITKVSDAVIASKKK